LFRNFFETFHCSDILVIALFYFKHINTAIMGYTDADWKAINTIRILAVCSQPTPPSSNIFLASPQPTAATQ
jgi:hypothetical protein